MSIRLRHPVPGARMTDTYGWRGAIPGVVAAQLHNGQDWAANAGTRILAAHDGWVAFNGWDPQGGGWLIEIRDDSGFATRYAHMNAPSHLAYGQRVKAGQKVGEVGATGWATGPHLHFILRLASGATTDPLAFIVNLSAASAKPKPKPAPKPKPKPLKFPEEDEDMPTRTIVRVDPRYKTEYTLSHPSIGLDLNGSQMRKSGNVNIYRGFMVTTSPSIGKAWCRMYGVGAGVAHCRLNRADYINAQSEARRLSQQINR